MLIDFFFILVPTMFTKTDLGKKNDFLDKAKAEREKRMQEKQKDASAVKIQVDVEPSLRDPSTRGKHCQLKA